MRRAPIRPVSRSPSPILLVLAVVATLAFIGFRMLSQSGARALGVPPIRAALATRDTPPRVVAAPAERRASATDEARTVAARPPRATDDAHLAIVGTVFSEQGSAPIPNATVRVAFGRGELTREALVRTTTDRTGAYRADVSLLLKRSVVARRSGSVAVRVFADGHGPSEQEIGGGELTIGDNVVDVPLTAAPVITGRVVTPDGAPVPGASVAFMQLYVGGCSSQPRDQTVLTDAGGRFVAGIDDGELKRVEASKDGLGHGTYIFAENADPTASHDVGDVVLRTRGTIAGRITCGDGTPVPGVEVRAAPTRSPGSPPFSDVRFAMSRTVTDALGRFRVVGLEGPSYTLHLYRDTFVPDEWGVRTDFGPFPTGTRDAMLELDSHVLLVRALDPDGLPLPGTTLDYGFATADRTEVDAASELHWGGSETRGDDSISVVPVTDFNFVTVSTWVPDSDHWVQERIAIDRGACVQEHELVVPTAVPTGRVALVLRDETGRRVRDYEALFSPVGPSGDAWGYEFYAEYDEDADGVLRPVATGDYDVSIFPGGSDSADAFLVPLHGEHPVRVEADAVQRIERTLHAGGRLRIKVRFASPESHDSRYVWIEWPGLPASDSALGTRAIDPTERLTFVEDGSSSARSSNHVERDRWFLSSALPRGVYRMRIDCGGCDPFERSVTIEPGHVTEVQAVLFPSDE